MNFKYWIKKLFAPKLPNKNWVFLNKREHIYYCVCLDRTNHKYYGWLHRSTKHGWRDYQRLTIEDLQILTTQKNLLTKDMKKTIYDLFKSGQGYGFIKSA